MSDAFKTPLQYLSLTMKSFTIDSPDKISVRAYSWLPDSQPVAALQIVHGMQEYAGRYDHFARWLNERGIAVYAEDHIGHGLTAKNETELAHFPFKDDWKRQVNILYRLTQIIKAEHPGLPVFLLGHSMGSVLTQTYMIMYGNEADGYILSGAIRQHLVMAATGRLLAKIFSALFGPSDRSKLFIALGYGQYNKHFKPNRTKADWLCSVDSVVDEYLESPLCGKRLTNRFYENFMYGFGFIAKPKNLRKIPAGKPVFIIAGEKDAAGFFGKAPVKIKKLLIQHAKAKVDLTLYPGSRHEILNEVNREEVYQDVLKWVRNVDRITEIIEKHFPPGSLGHRIYVEHCRAVTDLALRIAAVHPELGADTEILTIGGMLHDIGICFTDAPDIGCFGNLPYLAHGYKGRELLELEGLSHIAPVCERHIGVGITIEDIKKNNLPVPLKDMTPQTIEEKIICYADKFYSKSADNLSKPKPLVKVQKSIRKYGEDKWEVFGEMMEIFGVDQVYQ